MGHPRFTTTTWAALGAAAFLAACGGDGADTTPQASVSIVKVMGDSLADSGTFGFKATVQGSAPTGTGSTPIWPERVAASYGKTLCPYYVSTGSTFDKAATCTNYAVAGGRINYASAPTSPLSITQQMSDAGANGFTAQDLVLVDGGGNDAADLIGAYLNADSDGAATYGALLKSLLPAATVDAAFAGGATGMATVGGAYMQALAAQFSGAISANVLGKGATRVAVLNMPGVYNTPRLQMVLASIKASAGDAAAAQVLALSRGWVEAFNTRLAADFAGNAKVVVVDFYTDLNDQVANPSQFGLSNSTTPVCPVTGMGGDGLPTYSFPACSAAALSAMAPPAGAAGGADWWKSYAFSDSFHPTPYGHQLMGQMVSRSLSAAGWL
ncbi:SGNH/GDSL hydrolase family protein [Ramlibacter sp. H39-3-26]|uniref:SGNH/GDSL hydrolase family protein n=1 Tax=Curvibacter soli TaxID=3031331 RepID=UPI0023D9F776|nr:SGNH/GDSL hydrolase family protein [Ramlibacter sp. H39-3-26]MDF1484601.1 SGNH/GDSL hydrolase family protein [Ramlibacter sp. H39-3-26]